MKSDLYRVVGLYASTVDADHARELLVGEGIAATQIRVLTAATGAGTASKLDSDDVLKDLLRDGAIGTAVGTAAGAGVSVAMAAANLTLFIANPVLGVLSLVGWGAGLGGLVGAAMGAERSKGDVATLVQDALANGQVALVVLAHSEAEAAIARQVVGQLVGPLVDQRTDPAAPPAAGQTRSAMPAAS